MIKQEPNKKLIEKVILLFNKKKYLEALDLSNNIIDEYPDSILINNILGVICLLYTSPSPRDRTRSRMPSSA